MYAYANTARNNNHVLLSIFFASTNSTSKMPPTSEMKMFLSLYAPSRDLYPQT